MAPPNSLTIRPTTVKLKNHNSLPDIKKSLLPVILGALTTFNLCIASFYFMRSYKLSKVINSLEYKKILSSFVNIFKECPRISSSGTSNYNNLWRLEGHDDAFSAIFNTFVNNSIALCHTKTDVVAPWIKSWCFNLKKYAFLFNSLEITFLMLRESKQHLSPSLNNIVRTFLET